MRKLTTSTDWFVLIQYLDGEISITSYCTREEARTMLDILKAENKDWLLFSKVISRKNISSLYVEVQKMLNNGEN